MTVNAALLWVATLVPESEALVRPTANVPADLRPVRVTGPSDEQMATECRRHFFGDPLLRDLPLGITVRAGVVFLSGKVPDEGRRDHALRIAATTFGTKDVRNQLMVKEPARLVVKTIPGDGRLPAFSVATRTMPLTDEFTAWKPGRLGAATPRAEGQPRVMTPMVPAEPTSSVVTKPLAKPAPMGEALTVEEWEALRRTASNNGR
jgi:hypothetical protein